MTSIRQLFHDRGVVTRYALLKPWPARLVLALTGLLIVYGILSPEHKLVGVKGPTSEGDETLYRRIAERVHEGENYYLVTGSELRQRGYATRPFTNWRLPTMAYFLGLLPLANWGMPLFGILGLTTLLLWTKLLARELSKTMITCWALLFPTCILWGIASDEFLLHELWAGMLLTLALGAYARRKWRVSVILGILALLVRELVLPFVVIMGIGAWWRRRPRLAAAWAAGLLAFLAFLMVHAFIVSRHMNGADSAHEGWIQFGGWPFVLATARMCGLFSLLPKWVMAILFPLTILGLTGWRAPVAAPMALTVWAYALAFMVAGRACNYYWGFIYAPLLPIGVPFIFPALNDLWRAAFHLPAPAEITPSTNEESRCVMN